MKNGEFGKSEISIGSLTSCINISSEVFDFELTNENPDEECINCIFEAILGVPEGELRDICIEFYKKGRMRLEYKRTRKSYLITKEFLINSNCQFKTILPLLTV
jgi:hypothetical protein